MKGVIVQVGSPKSIVLFNNGKRNKGQQISTKAQATIWKHMQELFGEVTAEKIDGASVEQLQSLGMTFRKADYIKDRWGIKERRSL